MQHSLKNSVTWLKEKTNPLTIGLLPPPLGVEGPAPALVIVVDGVGVDVDNQPLVMEK